ncbi:hypothetical protein CCR83_01455 [Rhodobacter veldkampii DSM 11550]|uniref:Nitrogenase-stabilizing/protective protein NifW n=1 Tax=Phaeovulum veldkampii DSM 11550 TaxID=1185920 RepID=A0A2T4JG66_9RHOB|nr:nitrogenase stabilizing/protective protein NifW [Phaeovulum veldkampii]MBK5945146.1 hypothetical protein [Phaeovulum veldkampii DSM 11550]NCU20527.1 nitrogenase stabilizing/protective protein NifW [Candidatus Falkowbacteria bacterium]PTE16833.1 nitrogenase stabilizing/protective protein NifW [Phaeovulum veldkampii DSM 11550]TDQ54682.1 nitrogenase-stabilizing/protective protein [Phaeovulum veldkampii DSM 11550]
MTPRPALLSQITAAASAEDMFALLDLPFRPEVLNVARLHVLKRFGEYLARTEMDGLSDQAVFLIAREALAHAHQDFETSTPLEQKVFKVLANARPQRPAFVPLAGLRLAAD